MIATSQTILVVGGGMSGMTAALAGLDGHVIKPEKLKQFASRQK